MSITLMNTKSQSTSYLRRTLECVFLSLPLALFGCTKSEGPCESDPDCGEGFRCEVESGICLCAGDSVCDVFEFCNAAGFCQLRSGCVSNEDCLSDGAGCEREFCDVNLGQCVSSCFCQPDEGEECCTEDTQCAFGEICASVDGKCREGCRSDGDCRLGEGCEIDGFAPIGVCGGACTSDYLCDAAEKCDTALGMCLEDERGPYCGTCSGGLLGDCGADANFCLLNAQDPTGQSSFCGVDCGLGQECPAGFQCNNVIILSGLLPPCQLVERCINRVEGAGQCARHLEIDCVEDGDCPEGPPGSDCPKNKRDCDVGATCPGGSVCPENGLCPSYGNCVSDGRICERDSDCCENDETCLQGSCRLQECREDEGDAFGVCSCTEDSDCAGDTCIGADDSDIGNLQSGICEITGRECLSDSDCSIRCIGGGCRVGSNCTPANGRSCADLFGR